MNREKRSVCFRRFILGLFFSVAVLAVPVRSSAADVVVVVSSKVAQSALTKDNLKAIFLGQMTTWQSSAKVEFVTLKEGSEVHEAFLKKYIGRSASQFNNFWKQQVFTGKGRFPKQFDSESKLLEYVSANDSAIGYVSLNAAKGSSAKIMPINE
jgi:ABC-type phosphate transport system substrate-binding protein